MSDRIDLKLNEENKTEYLLSANSVELMTSITEKFGYIELKTKVNSNLVVGDIVYICALSGDTGVEYTLSNYVLDNVIEVSGCTDWYYHPYMKGYTIISTNNKKNSLVIDRRYETKFADKEILNHYLTKIYVENQNITGGDIDGVVYKNVIMNEPSSETTLDINLIQAIVLSGTSMKFMNIDGKYDLDYISLNTSIDYTTHITNNNNKYGYIIIKNQSISGSTIDNGWFYDCTLTDCTINNGFFTDCYISGGTINNGGYSGTTINESTNWLYGVWYEGYYSLSSWINGVWNSGEFNGKDWLNGVFNGGIFSGSTWRNGIFNGGSFTNSTWSGGTFNNSLFYNSIWWDGIFNGNSFSFSSWYNGNFLSGDFITSTWYNGSFYNGNFINNSNWLYGEFNNGNMKNSIWTDGIFYNGVMESCIWSGGTFNNGIMLGSNWYNGTFNDGIFNGLNSGLTYKYERVQLEEEGLLFKSYSSTWITGVFNGGELTNAYWLDGLFNNGVVNGSIMIKVEWKNGVFNGNVIGPLNYEINQDHIIYWSGGTFNNGHFGIDEAYIWSQRGNISTTWLGGNFYNGYYH